MAGERVLIVDDEIDVLELCKRILVSKNYQVKTARNGQEAIALGQQDQFDLLLTDIKMPGITGLEIAQAFKETDPGIICIAMTGFSTMDMVIKALKLGMDEFVMKPFAPEELSMAIAKTLEKERLRKENFRLRSLIPLFELNKTLMSVVETDEVLRRLIEIAQRETKATLASLYSFKEGKVIPYYHCFESEEGVQTQACEKLAQWILQNSEQLTLSSRSGEGEMQNIRKQLEMRAIIATPLKSKDSNLGALILGRKENEFAPSDSEFLAVLCGQASVALENARAYEELKVLDHMKSEFINIAAHELRTPLTILMGYATVLDNDLEEPAQGYVSSIMRNAMRLRSLIDDLLNLEYLESGVISLAHDKLDLSQVIKEIILDLSLMSEKKDLTIHIDIPSDFPTLITDRKKFDLIILNLLHNAIKFTPIGGDVTLSATTEKEYAIISVRDNGIGIPQEKLNRIFDRFYQVEPSLTREYGGIGVGLAIVKGMVEVCGGEIRVDSIEGKYTIFTFTLPFDNTDLKPRKLQI